MGAATAGEASRFLQAQRGEDAGDQDHAQQVESVAVAQERGLVTDGAADGDDAADVGTAEPCRYGKATVASDDELDMSLLDTVAIAGSRFDRMVKSR